jgi:hypothetical protein
MDRGIVFRREKPSLGVDEDLLGLQVTFCVDFVEGKNCYIYSLLAS